MIRKIPLMLLLVLVVVACAKKEEKKTAPQEVVTLTVSELMKNADDYVDRTVKLTGTVSHVCRKSGKKLFLLGQEEGQNFKINTGDNIPVFDVALEGSKVIAEGIIVKTTVEQEAHEHEHEDHDQAEAEGGDDCATKQIALYSMTCQSITESK